MFIKVKNPGILILCMFWFVLFFCCEQEDYPFYITSEKKEEREKPPGSEEDEIIAEIDYLVIRYYWKETGGVDLDTRTRLIDPERDAIVGWSRSMNDSSYVLWSDDNVEEGYESVLVDMAKIVDDYPDQIKIDIQMKAFWYNKKNSGDYYIEFVAYKEGEMVLKDFNWINKGGEQVGKVFVKRNTQLRDSDDNDGEKAGVARYEYELSKLTVFSPDSGHE